jgi:parvulin-like peptidyl-prolyl isomerase
MSSGSCGVIARGLALAVAFSSAWPHAAQAGEVAPASSKVSPAAATGPAGAVASPPARSAAAFATVGETLISGAQYQSALAVAVRNKYYHAKPPEAELAKFQREVGDDLVNRILLLNEARRRGVQPDRDKIAATLAGYEAQYKSSPNWQANREKMLASVRPRLEEDSLLERLGTLVKSVSEPAEAVVRAYYEQHRDLFVEPEQVRLSVILLKVDPSSPQALWNSAHEEARKLHQRLRGGADFAELARLHSADRSAEKGGQMDYTHRGMLPEALHGVVDKLKEREISEPVQVLEGVVILRLDNRRAALQRPFEPVKVRAAELWRRDQAQARWSQLIAELRRATTIRIDETQYAPLPAAVPKARAG